MNVIKIQEELTKDFDHLKELEKDLRCATTPNDRGKLENEIERIKERISKREEELLRYSQEPKGSKSSRNPDENIIDIKIKRGKAIALLKKWIFIIFIALFAFISILVLHKYFFPDLISACYDTPDYISCGEKINFPDYASNKGEPENQNKQKGTNYFYNKK